jgi:hypothetical protein
MGETCPACGTAIEEVRVGSATSCKYPECQSLHPGEEDMISLGQRSRIIAALGIQGTTPPMLVSVAGHGLW